ncbi:MAG: hypothetical protein AB8H79_13275 [Myxococcota bacterium]
MYRWAKIACVLAATTLATSAWAGDVQPRDPGHIGIGIGGHTRTSGLSAKYTVREALSLQGVVGIDPGVHDQRGGSLALSGSGLVEMPAIAENDDVELGWCVGAGPDLTVGGDFFIRAHAVLGLEVNVKPLPVEFSLEYRPSIGLVGYDFGPQMLEFGGHLRYWF